MNNEINDIYGLPPLPPTSISFFGLLCLWVWGRGILGLRVCVFVCLWVWCVWLCLIVFVCVLACPYVFVFMCSCV